MNARHLTARHIPKPRVWTQPVEPVPFPPQLRAQLARPNWSWADRFKREAIFAHYRPKIALALAQDHVAKAGIVATSYYEPPPPGKARDLGRWRDTWRDADAQTRVQHRELGKAHLNRAYDEQEIRDFAENYARTCAKMATLAHREDFAKSLGIAPPEGRNITDEGAQARMDSAKWWRRQLRASWTRRAENVMREIGIVRKGREPYATDDAVMYRHAQKERGRQFLESHVARNEVGEQLNLWKLAQGSVSNPALRRGEFMCRVRGFEEIAKTSGHVAQFWTLTTPSRFHAQLAAGMKNPKFAGAEVRVGQEWMCETWARVRAKLKRLSVLMYGFRIAEPHHDGTVHWHLLMFVKPRDAAQVEKVVSDYWIGKGEDRDELGPVNPETGQRARQEARCKLINIDWSKGSAVGYVAKYVSKNIDGAGSIAQETDEETGRLVADSVRRVDAWASIHRIRQFQQIGGPPVGVWREVRRVTDTCDDPDLERCRATADVGNWAGFIRAVSGDGIRAGRRVALKLERLATGERSQYAEEKPAPVVGVRFCSAVAITRPHSWRIERADTAQPADESTPRELRAAMPTRSASLHPGRGLCGLGLGDAYRNYRETGKTKGRRRAQVPATHRAAAPGGQGVSGSFSSSSPTWTRGNNCTQRHIPAPADTSRQFRESERWVNSWYREKGRYPTLQETRDHADKADG